MLPLPFTVLKEKQKYVKQNKTSKTKKKTQKSDSKSWAIYVKNTLHFLTSATFYLSKRGQEPVSDVKHVEENVEFDDGLSSDHVVHSRSVNVMNAQPA